MKIWNGYGSEHSMNLVMIGSFKTIADAEKVNSLIDELRVKLEDKVEIGSPPDRYSGEIAEILRNLHCHILGPAELEQFLYDVRVNLEDKKITITTDESEVSAFFKLMIENGAKVEIFSAHDYPEAE